MQARRPAALRVSTRLERVYTFTLYGGAPPDYDGGAPRRRLRCERGVTEESSRLVSVLTESDSDGTLRFFVVFV